jgi:hypothetical protein
MSDQTSKKPGVIACIKEFLFEASESSPITKEEILVKLVARFPDRPADSMRSTVYQQVPNKLRKAGFPVKKNGHGYWLPPPDESPDTDQQLTPAQRRPPETIRVDAEVYQALQKLAVPFVDKTPNDVLRRLLRLSTT